MKERWNRFKNTLYYYRPHLVIGGLVVVTAIVGVWFALQKAPDADLNISVLCDTFLLQEDGQQEVTQAVSEKLPLDINGDGQKLAYVDFLNGMSLSPEGRQRIDLEMAVGQSRLVLLDENALQAYGNEDYLTDLSEIQGLQKLDFAGSVYGISLKEDSFLSQYFPTQGLYAGLKVIKLDEENQPEVLQEYENAKAIMNLICASE